MRRYSVYRATNKVNGKAYIGFAANMNGRRYVHYSDARSGSSLYFHRALRKYKESDWCWEILVECETREEAANEEKRLILLYGTFGTKGYNGTVGGEGVPGYKHTEKMKQKFSDLKKGKSWEELYGIDGAEKRRLALRERNKNKDTHKKISNTLKGRKQSEETIRKRAQSRIGQKLSEETKKKISISRRRKYETV